MLNILQQHWRRKWRTEAWNATVFFQGFMIVWEVCRSGTFAGGATLNIQAEFSIFPNDSALIIWFVENILLSYHFQVIQIGNTVTLMKP